MTKKIILIIIVLIVVAFVAYNYLMPSDDDNDTAKDVTKDITIGSFFRAVDYAPYLVARDQGWFDEVANEYSVNLSYVEFQSLPSVNEAFATDNVDMVFEAEPPAIIGRSAGIGILIADSGVSLIQEILVHTDSEIREVKDLKGKKIAVLAGTSSHYGLVKILEAAGLSRDDVEVLDMVPPDAKAAFGTNQVDAWAVWPPFVEQEVLSGLGRTLGGGDVFIQSIVAVREKFSVESPELLSDLLAVVGRAQDWILANEESAQQIIATELDLELAVVVEAWPKHNFKPPFGDDEIADIQAKADFLLEVGLIDNKVNVGGELIKL
ncbi:hypothetical protein LCGC14_2220450 [marine sediment metagenome]|uniref:Solute-binding protein family 3/N-terminal domain-containing protein n=1 Tax=marine sediment metagenome TaxID=412755 RepID=A0A0F9DB45_9ZZZZ